MSEKPTWEPLWLRCKDCDLDFDDWQPCHVPIPVWLTHVRLIRCPHCDGKELYMRSTPRRPPGFVE